MIQEMTELAPPPESDVIRALPHAVGPEKSVLSTLLQYPEEFCGRAIEAGITAEHFYDPGRRILFEVIQSDSGAGRDMDLVALTQRLLDAGKLDRIGGPSALMDLYTYSPTPASFEGHCRMLHEKRTGRGLIEACNEAISEAYATPDGVRDTVGELESRLTALHAMVQTTSLVSPRDLMPGIMARLQAATEGSAEGNGLPTGYEKLDTMGGTLKPGELFVIAARPSMGKTSFLCNILEKVCVDDQVPAVVFSLEMTSSQLVERMVYGRAKFSAAQISRGHKPSKGDLMRIQRAMQEVAAAPLTIDGQPAITIAELRAKARRLHREGKCRVIGIDYLQLMRSGSKQAKDSREREVAEISAGLKALAKELDIPVIVLAQLNRGPESRSGKNLGVPRMSDLRESGAIEQDADLIGLLYRKSYYAQNEEDAPKDDGRATLNLAKNRNGETGDVPLTWIASLMRFENGGPVQEEPEQQTLRSRW